MGLPVQEPLPALKAWPSVAVPLIVGNAVLAGAAGGGGGGACTAATVADAADVAAVEPPSLVAVTTTRTVSPTSLAVSDRVAALAPAIFTQLPPEELQDSHW